MFYVASCSQPSLVCVISSWWEAKFHTHTKAYIIMVVYILIFTFLIGYEKSKDSAHKISVRGKWHEVASLNAVPTP